MKKLTLSMTIALIICLASSIFANGIEVTNLTDKLIRVHIVANSDSEADQALKLAVRDSLSPIVGELLPSSVTKEKAAAIINEHLSDIVAVAESVIADNGYNYPVSAKLSPTTFPIRNYDDFTLPAGEYDALCITIGSGQGRNFWCVLYPSLCLGSVMKIDDAECFTQDELIIVKQPQKVRYKLFCYELYRRIKALF